MRSLAQLTLVAAVTTLIAGAATAHQVVDVKVSIGAPGFVAARQRFTYQIIADDLANDSALGVVVTTALPPSVAFVKAAGSGWSCSESKLRVTCSAEQIAPGPNAITIDVTAPAAPGPVVSAASVESVGSLDLNSSNDTATSSTTIYDPAVCTATSLQILQPVDTTAPLASPMRLSWTAVPDNKSYSVYAAVEGERSSVVATTTDTSLVLAIERGNVEWRVEAFIGTCPTVSSVSGRFFSAGKAAALSLQTYAGHPDRAGVLDGPRMEATFMSPAGLAVDGAGNLFASDAASFTVREISAGQVTTPAGNTGVAGSADGRPGSFAGPLGMAYSPIDDFILIADRANNIVRLRYPGDRQLGYVLTIGGAPGQAGMVDGLFEVSRLSAPSAVAPDPRGRLYVADTNNHRIRKMTSVPGYVGYYTTATFAGGAEGYADGSATLAQFRSPSGVAVDGEEIVYVADTGNNVIRKIAGGAVTTLAGLAGSPGSSDGYGAEARFNAPTAIAVDARGNIYVCDTGNHTIRKVSPSGLVTTVAGLAGSSGDSEGSGRVARLSAPGGITVDASGALYIADTGNHRIVIAHVAVPLGDRRRAALP